MVNRQNEGVRLREYFYVINRAKKITQTDGMHSEKYQWIFKEIYRHRRVLFIDLLFPPMPFCLRLTYYKFFVVRLAKPIFDIILKMGRIIKKMVGSG